ncbi:hypothetical protein J2S44_000742 [Catenuloplanes niger]|uniref:Uncharacterized protein n=1 Tax=Catenuloplanes niger TaxID=587534 RepID=A0AAE3ZK76_9ACTN|nr:hypothetical protein [Catenuloplanes niger]
MSGTLRTAIGDGRAGGRPRTNDGLLDGTLEATVA